MSDVETDTRESTRVRHFTIAAFLVYNAVALHYDN